MGSLYILAAIFLWSSLGVVVKSAGMPLHILVFYSLLVSLVLMGPVAARGGGGFSLPKGKMLFGLLMIGPLSLLNTMSFFFAFRNTTIANAVLTHYIAPLAVALLSPVFLKEPLTKRIAASIAIATAGLYIMLGIGPGGFSISAGGQGRATVGMLSGLLSGITYAALIIVLRVYAQSMRPIAVCFFQNLSMALMLLPFAGGLPAGGLWAILFMGIVHSTIAPILYVKGMALVRASRAAILGYIEPVCAIILGLVILGEEPRAVSLVGGAMILFSGYLTLKKGA